jgi:stage II sporulation protein D
VSWTRRDLLLATGATAGALLVPGSARAEQRIRIAVGRFTGAVDIAGDGLEVRGGDGRVLSTKSSARLRADARGIRLGELRTTSDLLHVTAPGPLRLRGHTYHRRLEVSLREHKGRRELLVVHPLPLETYVLGVVSSELPKRWPYEALKVQAVATRTYAIWQKYRRLELPYHMESTVLDQVYHGAQREHADARRAIEETFGRVMTWGRRPVEAYFHAACGDHTESAREGWGRALPYLPGSRCGFCKKATRYNWDVHISSSEMDRAFSRLLGESVKELRILSRTKTGRAKRVEVQGASRKKTINGSDLRRLVGYSNIWSTLITRLEKKGGGFAIAGRGAGHGVGMCQWGARGMAEAGHEADAILRRYYRGVKIVRMY